MCCRGYLSAARCRLAYGPADPSATHCLLLQEIQIGFGYQLIRVVPDKIQRAVKRLCVCVKSAESHNPHGRSTSEAEKERREVSTDTRGFRNATRYKEMLLTVSLMTCTTTFCGRCFSASETKQISKERRLDQNAIQRCTSQIPSQCKCPLVDIHNAAVCDNGVGL